jgi:thiamine-monophosphate kinase
MFFQNWAITVAMTEFDLIARYFAPLATHSAARGLMDDAAVLPLPPPGHELVITKDMIAQGVHFRADHAPEFVAQWLMAVNLSDLAAMGATPLGCVLGLGLPKDCPETWIAGFADALGKSIRQYDCPLLGGDTISGLAAPVLSLTAFGSVPAGMALGRAGARAGDLLVVSGTIGTQGMAELRHRLQNRRSEPNWHFINPTHEPVPQVPPMPRLVLGEALRGVATACADVSDGLLADAGHLAVASGLAVEVNLATVPVDDGWADLEAARVQAVTAGDDYELAFALPPTKKVQILTLQQQLGLKLTVIGRFVDGQGVRLLSADGRDITPAWLGYQHG